MLNSLAMFFMSVMLLACKQFISLDDFLFILINSRIPSHVLKDSFCFLGNSYCDVWFYLSLLVLLSLLCRL